MKRSWRGRVSAIRFGAALLISLAGCNASKPSDADLAALFRTARSDLDSLIVFERAYGHFVDTLSTVNIQQWRELRRERNRLGDRLGLAAPTRRDSDSLFCIRVWGSKYDQRGFVYFSGSGSVPIQRLFSYPVVEDISLTHLEGPWYSYRVVDPPEPKRR